MNVLAKSIARVTLLVRLEPSARASLMDDDGIFVAGMQCPLEPNANDLKHDGFPWM